MRIVKRFLVYLIVVSHLNMLVLSAFPLLSGGSPPITPPTTPPLGLPPDEVPLGGTILSSPRGETFPHLTLRGQRGPMPLALQADRQTISASQDDEEAHFPCDTLPSLVDAPVGELTTMRYKKPYGLFDPLLQYVPKFRRSPLPTPLLDAASLEEEIIAGGAEASLPIEHGSRASQTGISLGKLSIIRREGKISL